MKPKSKFSLNLIMAVVMTIDDMPCTITHINKETGITYSHIWNMLKYLGGKGIIATRKDGRKRIITLSTKGLMLHMAFKKIAGIMAYGQSKAKA